MNTAKIILKKIMPQEYILFARLFHRSFHFFWLIFFQVILKLLHLITAIIMYRQAFACPEFQ